jgi:hypothetical protein
VVYNWNLTFAHVLIDRLWPILQQTFHREASLDLLKSKEAYVQAIKLLSQDIAIACKAQKLPNTCKDVIPRLTTSLDNIMSLGIAKTVVECRQLPTELLDSVESRIREKLGPVYRAAPTITYTSGSKYNDGLPHRDHAKFSRWSCAW